MAVQGLGYVVIGARDPAAWDKFLTEVVGVMRAGAASGANLYRIDERPFRFWIEKSDTDALIAPGWDMGDGASFEAAAKALRAADRAVEIASASEAAARRVKALARSSDPAGNAFEFTHGDARDGAVFASPAGVSGFVTGKLGMGHVVLPAPNFDETHQFYKKTFGFGDTDLPRFKFTPDPKDPGMGFAFMHGANGRHHSLALGEMPAPPSKCIHMMLEMATLVDVGRCYDRMRINKVPVSATLGRHVNDEMTSFYMQTPGGFDLEIGCDGLVVDPKTWKATAHQKVSEWGHVWAWQQAMEAKS